MARDPGETHKTAAANPVNDEGRFINAIIQQESGGDYSQVTRSGNDAAYGKYQVMGANIAQWSKEILGHSITKEQYLASPQIQDKIAQGKLTHYYRQYGAAGAASAWFTGSPTTYKTHPDRSDGHITASRYVSMVLSRMTDQTGAPGQAPAAASRAPINWGNADDPGYQSANITTVTAKNGVKFSVNRQIAPNAVGFINALIDAGYSPKEVQGYNNRNINSPGGKTSNRKSNHAYGAAFDIDPGANPQYGAAGGKFALPPNVAALAASFGLNWGGNFKSSKDYMHFESSTGPASAGKSTYTGPAVQDRTGAVTGDPMATSLTDSSPAGIRAAAQSKYGYLAAFLDDKEIGPILLEATRGDWDLPTLQGAIFGTKWYKTHSATTRLYDANAITDPATARANVNAQRLSLQQQAQKTGLTIEPARLEKIVNDSLRFGWTPEQTSKAMLAEGKFDLRGTVHGDAQTQAAGLKEQAAQQLVPISDATLQQWTKQIEAGTATAQNFADYLKEQAKSLFPSLSHAIDSGVSVAQYADPYKQLAASTLELNPNDVNFTDPKWSKALFQIDPKTGARTAMSLNDWTQTLKTDPTYGYAKTHQANAQVADFATSLLNTFGRIAN